MSDPEQLDPDEGYRRRFDEQELLRAAEEAQEQLERNTRTLGEFLSEAMLQGDEVTVELGEVSITGHVLGVNWSLVRVRALDHDVDLNLDAVTSVRVTSGDAARAAHVEDLPVAFVGRLRQLTGEHYESRVRLVTTSSRELSGQVEAASEGHVEFRSEEGGLWAIPMQRVAYVSVVRTG